MDKEYGFEVITALVAGFASASFAKSFLRQGHGMAAWIFPVGSIAIGSINVARGGGLLTKGPTAVAASKGMVAGSAAILGLLAAAKLGWGPSLVYEQTTFGPARAHIVEVV